MNMQLSIIIVNYNGLKYLKNCFDAIYDKLESISFEIIVVDNNSSDESCSFIKENYPKINLIESDKNLGFGKANNLGVQHAKGDIILLLNNDTILLDEINDAIKALISDESIGAVTINMLNAEKKYLHATGQFPTPLKLIKISLLSDKRKEFKTGIFDESKIYNADWITGAFMLIRKCDYLSIGGFDDDYFMYVEDVDICKKLDNINKRCIFIPRMKYIHFVGFNKTREKFLIEGYRIYVEKHFSGFSKFVANTMLTINTLVKRLKN